MADRDLSDDESDIEGEDGDDGEPCLNENLPPWAPAFEVDYDIDLTSQAL